MTDPDGPPTTRDFYDSLAATYDLVYPDWATSVARQGAVLDQVLTAAGVPTGAPILDCACGIGTQSLGLAAAGRNVTGTDLSPVAVTRARVEAEARGLAVGWAAADMRALPFCDRQFAAVVCADNSLPHLTTPAGLARGLGEMQRVLQTGGTLVLTVRDYDRLREERPESTTPSVRSTPTGRVITFQLWHWHDDGEHYDYQHFQLSAPDAGGGTVQRRTASYWALTRHQIEHAAHSAGLTALTWHEPTTTGFFQPILTARAS